MAAAAKANGPAIAVMCLGVLMLVVNDVLAKWLTATYTPLQIVFVRNIIALPSIAAFIVLTRGPGAFRTGNLRLHAVRGFFAVCAAFTFFSGIAILPLAEATSIAFVAPIIATALSVPLLKERVGWRRWMAVLVGFAGVLIVVRPGAATFQPASFYLLGTAFFYAVYMITAGRIERDESFWTMSFYVVLFPTIYSALVVPFLWSDVDPAHLLVFAAQAFFGTIGINLMAHAFRMGDASVVAPFDYTALIWASLFGWLVWGDLPGLWTYTGAAVIIGSGIYIVYRETRVPRAEPDPPSHQHPAA